MEHQRTARHQQNKDALECFKCRDGLNSAALVFGHVHGEILLVVCRLGWCVALMSFRRHSFVQRTADLAIGQTT